MHWKILTALLAATLVIAACGGDDDDDGATPTPGASTPAASGGVVTATPGAVASFTPGPVIDSGLFSVVDSISYVTDNGLYFVGEVQNNSDKNAIIGVDLSLADEAGTEVGTGSDRLQGWPFTRPGEKMPFKMLIAGGPESWSAENFAVTGREATEAEVAKVYSDFEFEGAVTVQSEQGILVQSLLQNTGTEAMNPIKVTFIARDADGRIIGAWGTNPSGGLAPGAETVLGFPVLDVPSPPPSFELTAYGCFGGTCPSP